jgi:hypothetical protein
MIDFTQLFCSRTDRALSDLKEQDIERLQFSVFCAMCEEHGYNLLNLSKSESHKIESVCTGNSWLLHALTHNIIYRPPCSASDDVAFLFQTEGKLND